MYSLVHVHWVSCCSGLLQERKERCTCTCSPCSARAASAGESQPAWNSSTLASLCPSLSVSSTFVFHSTCILYCRNFSSLPSIQWSLLAMRCSWEVSTPLKMSVLMWLCVMKGTDWRTTPPKLHLYVELPICTCTCIYNVHVHENSHT